MYLEEMVAGFRVSSVSGRENSTIDITETTIGNAGGAKYRRKKDSTKDLEVAFNLVNSDEMGLQKSVSLLRSYTDGEDVRWVFIDEPDVYWTGTVKQISCSHINAKGSGVYALSGSLTIHCSKPYKYSITKFESRSSTNTFADQMQLVNTGTVPVPLNIEAKMKSKSGYLGFTLDSPKGNQYYMFGSPKKTGSDVSSPDISDQIDLINTGFSTQPDNWIVNAGVMPPIGSETLTQSGSWSFKTDSYWDVKEGSNQSVEVGLTSPVHTNYDGSNNGMYCSARITEQSQNTQNKTTTVHYTYTARYSCSSGYWWGGTTRNEAGYLDIYLNGELVDTITLKVVNGWTNDTLIDSRGGTRTFTHSANGELKVSLQLVCRNGAANDPLRGGVYYEDRTSNIATLVCTPMVVKKPTLPNGQQEGYCYPTDYGDGSGWHGPSLSKLIAPTNGVYPTNWRLSYRFDFNNDGMPNDEEGRSQLGKAYGIQSVVVADRAGNPMVSVVYADNDSTEYSEFTVYIGRTRYQLGGSSDKNQFHVCGTVSRNMAALVVEKVGTDIHVTFKYPSPSDSYKALDIDKHFSYANKDTQVGSITLYAAKYGNDTEHLAVVNNLFRYVQFTQLKGEAVQSNEIVCCFHNNDIVTIDNDTNKVLINGAVNWDWVDISSDVLMLYPGVHVLKYAADAESTEASPDVTVMYREGWK